MSLLTRLMTTRDPAKRCMEIFAEFQKIHEEFRCLEEKRRNKLSRSCASSMENHGREAKELTEQQIEARQKALTARHQQLQQEYQECTRKLRDRGQTVPTVRLTLL